MTPETPQAARALWYGHVRELMVLGLAAFSESLAPMPPEVRAAYLADREALRAAGRVFRNGAAVSRPTRAQLEAQIAGHANERVRRDNESNRVLLDRQQYVTVLTSERDTARNELADVKRDFEHLRVQYQNKCALLDSALAEQVKLRTENEHLRAVALVTQLLFKAIGGAQ